MILLFLASVLAGVVLSAPIGVTGALIAEAALARDRRKLRTNILAATLADLLLAALVAMFAVPVAELLQAHRREVLLIAGVAFVGCGLAMGLIAWRQRRDEPKLTRLSASSSWLLAHLASGGTAFFGTVLHPGSIAAFLVAGAMFALKIPHFQQCPYLFVFGIGIGALAMYAAVAFLFWQFSQAAARFMLELRYGLALFIVGIGVYLFIRGWC